MANFTGGPGNDRIFGTSEADTIDGRGGDDELFGLGGDDLVLGDLGNDLLEGGDGADRLGGGPGDDVVRGEGGEDRLWGSDGNDLLGGGDGDDVLDGGLGIDRMWGGNGDDIYIVDHVQDEAIEKAGFDGIDKVRSSVSFTLGPRLEQLTLTGTTAIDGTGNALDNLIVGNAAANLLRGEAGADLLFGQDGDDLLGGGDGDDVLDGGAGADRMWGSHGNDVYIVDDVGDEAIENPGVGGIDRVEASVSYTLGARIENLTLTGSGFINGTGNELANTIIGNAAGNVLDGGAGADTMIGGGGNDSYVVDDAGDQIVEEEGGGIDRVTAWVSYTLPAFVEDLTLAGDSPIEGTGNALRNVILGNSADNVLIGGEGDDRLFGEGGDDRIEGGLGTDTLFGGDGNDLLLDQGQVAPARMFGEAGNDVLDGGGQLDGGPGDDVLRNAPGGGELLGGDGNDVIHSLGGNRVGGGAGDDTIHLSATSSWLRVEAFGGPDNDSFIVTGWNLNSNRINVIDGGTGTDRLRFDMERVESLDRLSLVGIEGVRGSAGDDVLDLGQTDGVAILSGWLGNDTLIGTGAAEQFFFESALDEVDNVDSILDFETSTDKIVLLQAIFSQLDAGALDPEAFVVGPAAADADDRIVYDRDTGALFYDADGAGSGAAIQFATLWPPRPLSADNFLIVTEPLFPGG